MKIIDNTESKPTSISAKDIPLGTTFYGNIGGYKRLLMVRAFETLVGLASPEDTWTATKSLTVLNYEPVEVEVVVKRRL